MCTVTFVPFSDRRGRGVRIACNRDESRQRPAARAPQRRRFGKRWSILPVDPVSNGTWIAVNDAGLVLALLNRNTEQNDPAPLCSRSSRGTIIPGLLHCDSVAGAMHLATEVTKQPFAPFRLILADRREVVEISSARQEACIVETPLSDRPLLFTSSGLGDELVEGPRRRLFQEAFGAQENWLPEQEAFHRHSWPDEQHVSVCMRRRDACTVSYTVIELRSDSATMTYFANAPDLAGPSVAIALDLQPVEAA